MNNKPKIYTFFKYLLALFGALVLLIVPINIYIFYSGSSSPNYHSAKSDMRSIALGIESYWIDNDKYPAHAKGDLGINYHLPNEEPAHQIYTFHASTEKFFISTITTPIAYLSSIPYDIFGFQKWRKKTHYGYYNHSDKGWVVFSPGPDGDYDIDPEKDYDPSFRYQPYTRESHPDHDPSGYSSKLLFKTYDPTNGTKSNGDILMTKGDGLLQ